MPSVSNQALGRGRGRNAARGFFGHVFDGITPREKPPCRNTPCKKRHLPPPRRKRRSRRASRPGDCVAVIFPRPVFGTRLTRTIRPHAGRQFATGRWRKRRDPAAAGVGRTAGAGGPAHRRGAGGRAGGRHGGGRRRRRSRRRPAGRRPLFPPRRRHGVDYRRGRA